MTRLPLDLATLQDEWQSGTTETTETTVTGFGGEGGGERNSETWLPLNLAALQDEWQSGTTETAETAVTGLWAILGALRAFSGKALRCLGSLGGLGCLDLALDTKCCVPIE